MKIVGQTIQIFRKPMVMLNAKIDKENNKNKANDKYVTAKDENGSLPDKNDNANDKKQLRKR